jgi:hypothetical protein
MPTKREYYEAEIDTFTSVTGTTWKDQNFTVGQSGDESYALGIVSVYGICDEGVGDLIIEIQSDAAGQPSGTILGSGTITFTQIRAEDEGWHDVLIDEPFVVAKDSVLHIVAHVSGGTFYWRMRQTDPLYDRGGPCTSGDSGVTWTGPAATADRLFRVWGDVIVLGDFFVFTIYDAGAQNVTAVWGEADTPPTDLNANDVAELRWSFNKITPPGGVYDLTAYRELGWGQTSPAATVKATGPGGPENDFQELAYILPGVPAAGVWYLRGTYLGHTFETTVGIGTISKPVNPTPANNSGPGVDFSEFVLDWEDGGGGDTYDVYIGSSASEEDLVLVSEGQSGTSYVTSLEELPHDQRIYWKVDAWDGGNYAEGDVWNFDPRPAKPTNPTPTDAATKQNLGFAALLWEDGGAAATYDVTFSGSPVSVGQAGTSYPTPSLGYSTTYTWRVDAKNAFGTTTGDVWSFTTLDFHPPIPSWENLPEHTLGPLNGGTVGTDFRWTGQNATVTVRRMVAAAMNRIYYEDV